MNKWVYFWDILIQAFVKCTCWYGCTQNMNKLKCLKHFLMFSFQRPTRKNLTDPNYFIAKLKYSFFILWNKAWNETARNCFVLQSIHCLFSDSSAEDHWWIGLIKVDGVWKWNGTADVSMFTGNVCGLLYNSIY